MRGILWCIFGILFVLSIAPNALGQQSDSALTQSQFEKILEKIEESEKETRAYIDQKFDKLDTKIDQKFGELDKKIDDLNTKFNKLDKDVAVLSARLNLLQWIIAIIGAPFLISIIILFVQMRLNQQNSAEIVSKVAAEVAARVAAEVVTENRDESDEDIMLDNLRNTQPSESEIA
ncbi:hypothetical protein C6496_13810 [Candidatus Poribacteria bacterium]|nr:MAG: hypothetical protein C6496_13810 [Candidatus Poribacteria bacterium]